MATQTSPSDILERIADIRQQINDIAGAPEVLALVVSGEYHPDLRLGDAIQALDELAYALQEFLKATVKDNEPQKQPMILLQGGLV
ncbi:hypothetical protein NIES4073_02990 (plasmid) [Kalymmatonema gypsitolerans NIES-4073]|jgi:hypothetical protein|nr:hypothetical protein [Scytonema hyalinum WJT4-NPBG1]BAZ19429.1 hypothetical protein NIES4073_02990 [Scytonema sp. NIES-4073]